MRRERGKLVLRRISYVLVGAAALALVAGCGGKKGAQTFTVDVDGHNGKANEAFIAYFPNTVTIHPGDTVVFDNKGNGEPHTATLGTLIDPVVNAFDKLTPAQLQSSQGPPKALQALDAKIPQLLPQGPGDAVQASANPCVLASGTPPAKTACPKQNPQPDFDGTQSFYNSGWLDSKAKFTVKLSKSTAPGTYHFMCLLHREGMTGKIVVVPSSTAVASPSEQYASGQKQLAAIESKLAPAVAAERQGKPPIPGIKLPGAHPALAGSGSQNAQEAEVTEFGPKKISIPVGGSVTWYIIGPHSLTFNSDKTNNDIRSVAADGSVHINVKAAAPANAPGEPPSSNGGGGGPSNGPPKFNVVASKTWDGTGFLNTGVFTNSFGPPLIEGYTITFTKAGTYKYLCTVHDNMTGEVDVG
jgi:plastocyanin